MSDEDGIEEGTPKEEVSELLYRRVAVDLDGLAAEYTRPMGVMLAHMKPNQTGGGRPVVKMGWAQFRPALSGIENCPADKTFPHVLSLTEEGIEIVNGLRQARGHVTLQERAQMNRKRRDDAIERYRVAVRL